MTAPKGNNYAEKPPGDAKDRHLHIRVRESDWEMWRLAAAEAKAESVSEFVRSALNYVIALWIDTQGLSNSGGKVGANHQSKTVDRLGEKFPLKRN